MFPQMQVSGAASSGESEGYGNSIPWEMRWSPELAFSKPSVFLAMLEVVPPCWITGNQKLGFGHSEISQDLL